MAPDKACGASKSKPAPYPFRAYRSPLLDDFAIFVIDGRLSNMTHSFMKKSTWRILDRGDVPDTGVSVISLDCVGCGNEADLPVLGLPLAQIGMGIVFDIGQYAMPRIIQCRSCRRRFETEAA